MRFLKENWLGLVIVVALPLASFTLRSEATAFQSPADFERLITSGQPTVLDFFSNG